MWLAFRGEDVQSQVIGTRGDESDDPMGAFLCLLGGLALWSVTGFVWWRQAAWRFRVLTGRVPGTEAGPAKPRPRRLRRVMIAALALVVLLPVGWGVYRSVSADRHLDDALDEVSRADPGWRLPEIEAARKPVAADENPSRLVLTAGGLVPRWNAWPGQNLADDLDKLEPQVRLSDDQHCRVIGDLEEVGAARAQVAPLIDVPEGRYTVAWSRDFISTPLPHIDVMNRLRTLLQFDLTLRAEEGDADGALADCRRLLNLGRTLGDEPLLVSQSVRNNAARLAARWAARVLAQGEPSDAALAELQRGFAAELSHPGMEIGLRGERASLDGLMALIQRGDFPWQFVIDWSDRDDVANTRSLDTLLFSVTPGAEKESRAAALRHNTGLIALARLPESEQPAAFAAADARRKQLPLLARLLTIRGASASRRFLEGRAELRCAVAALAAERYRRRHGDWPARLEDLIPDLLEKVPDDPFTGRPLLLRRLDDGIVIYSVGADGQDDGGADVGPVVKGDGEKAKDVGFRLWDVARRRQEPPPARENGAEPNPGE